ncbi:hypothetical protein M0802_003654 [Mischocyttarus mexicanus]|nr:hypothetical protein M0802_003654 [Mischocyttarus mexicanus]
MISPSRQGSLEISEIVGTLVLYPSKWKTTVRLYLTQPASLDNIHSGSCPSPSDEGYDPDVPYVRKRYFTDSLMSFAH